MCGVKLVAPTRIRMESPALAENAQESLPLETAIVPLCVGPLGNGVCAWPMNGTETNSKISRLNQRHVAVTLGRRTSPLQFPANAVAPDKPLSLYNLMVS